MRPVEDDAERNILLELLRRLPEREQTIIAMRFGLFGRDEMTQKEVADALGISQSYISRLEKKIINRLRKDLSRVM
jgi:RNA polymerase sporulation-specific sigma factor